LIEAVEHGEVESKGVGVLLVGFEHACGGVVFDGVFAGFGHASGDA
jgi:hypothetical protein